MFAAVLTFAIVTAHVTAEIPLYIHVCSRRDPNLDQCIINNVNNLKYKICEGMPELDIAPNDPLHLDKIVMIDTNNIKLDIKDAHIKGLCDFDINFLHTDMEKLHYDVNLSFKQISVNSTCHFEIRILVPIVGSGLIYITTDNISADANMDMKMAISDGKRYLYLSKIRINLNITNFDAQYGSDLDSKQLQEIVSNFIGINQEEILKHVKPPLEEAISKVILSVSNKIVTHFTYEELFPERL